MLPDTPYVAGLVLTGRAVAVVGGGRVAARRVPRLLAAGALVRVISPALHEDLAALADAGKVTWLAREYRPGDVADAWYVLAATSSPAVNATVAAEAERSRIFCVRADDAAGGSAWTPASGERDGLTIPVLGRGEPRRAKHARNRLLEVTAAEEL